MLGRGDDDKQVGGAVAHSEELQEGVSSVAVNGDRQFPIRNAGIFHGISATIPAQKVTQPISQPLEVRILSFLLPKHTRIFARCI